MSIDDFVYNIQQVELCVESYGKNEITDFADNLISTKKSKRMLT